MFQKETENRRYKFIVITQRQQRNDLALGRILGQFRNRVILLQVWEWAEENLTTENKILNWY